MSNIRDIGSLPIARGYIETLYRNGFRVVQDLMGLKPSELAQETKLTVEEAFDILQTISSTENKENESKPKEIPIQSVRELLTTASINKPIITFCKELDMLLGGGVPCGQITEFCGVPGIGKTQMGIQLALNVQIPKILNGQHGRALYIDTEGSFLPERVKEMATELVSHLKRLMKIQQEKLLHTQSTYSHHSINLQQIQSSLQQLQEYEEKELCLLNYLQNIQYYRCHQLVELLSIIHKLSHDFMSFTSSSSSSSHNTNTNTTTSSNIPQLPIKLIIIDSIAFLFRANTQDYSTKNRLLSQLLTQLNQLANQYQIAIVLINHVITKKRHSSPENSTTMTNNTQELTIVPALGEFYSHMLTNRVLLHWKNNHSTTSMSSINLTRQASLLKSSSMPRNTIDFMVNHKGIRDISLPSNTNTTNNNTNNNNNTIVGHKRSLDTI